MAFVVRIDLMTYQLIIFIALLTLFGVWRWKRNTIRYWVELWHERGLKSTVHYDRCLTVFKTLYTDVNGMGASLQERREKGIMHDTSFTYGEVTFYSFVRILEKATPLPGEIFYDLGSGSGKAVFVAGLIFDFAKVCGIEKLDSLYTLSTSLLKKLDNLPERKQLLPTKQFNIDFIHDDFLSVDFHDADIIFINATCFRGDLFQAIIQKLLKLKLGARIILGSANLENIGGFQLIYSNMHLMSWGLNQIRIYQRV